MAGEGEHVVVGVEKEREMEILGGDVVHVGGVAENLEDPVPVAVVVVDPRLAGEERVDDRQEVLRGIVGRVRLTRADGEGARTVQVTRAQELVGGV